jgi:hypothetical protein
MQFTYSYSAGKQFQRVAEISPFFFQWAFSSSLLSLTIFLFNSDAPCIAFLHYLKFSTCRYLQFIIIFLLKISSTLGPMKHDSWQNTAETVVVCGKAEIIKG